MTSERTIRIFDTTLRDGEQSPGASMNLAEKIEIAHALKRLGVDVIEAGFPIASPGDFEAVRAVAEKVSGPIVAGLARCVQADIEKAAEALKPAKRPCIHVFCATSEIHLRHKLRKTEPEVLEMIRKGVSLARTFVEDVEFSAEDASRSEPTFLAKAVREAVASGATTINIPDTVGYVTPDVFTELIRGLFENVPELADVVLSVHCHDDLGMAVANSLAAVRAGAGQIECTINGIGERAGNCSLEEVVMALKVRKDHYQTDTGVQAARLFPTSRLVSGITGMHVQRNKAIVGENAFAHEAGVHQDGMLKHPQTYEIMRPENVGFGGSKLVMGKHSGRHALREKVVELGYHLVPEQVEKIYEQFTLLADKKKEVFDEDIEALIEEQLQIVPQVWQLEGLHVSSATGATPTAAVTIRRAEGESVTDAAVGDGPVDAIYSAIQRVTGVSARLLDYQIRAVTRGKDAMGEVSLAVDVDGKPFRARAHSTDIIEASALAYLAALNRAAPATS